MKYLFTLLLGVSVLMSCSDSTRIMSEETSMANLYFITQDSAIILANKVVASISGISCDATRGIDGRKVKNVSIVNDVLKSRSALDNGISKSLYIVNYENDKGFAVVSSDKRLQPIYAVSDSGSLNIRDTIDNKGLALFFSGVQSSIARATADSPMIGEISDTQSCIFYPQVSPLISTNARKWSQEYPYNLYCPTIDGTNALVGCAPVACSLIMSYYMWPKTVTHFATGQYQVSLPWRSMKNGGNNKKVALLFRLLGYSDLLKTTYGKDESVSNSDSIASTFIKMGYYSPSRFTKMSNLSTICSILDKAKDGTTSNSGDGPLLVAARCLSGGAHVWVVDGYAKNPVSKNDGSVFNHIYLHCVWGNKNGVNNGYFYINDKGRVGGKASLYDLEDTGGNDVAEVYWYDGLYYMSNFRKNTNNALGNVEI